MIWHVQYTERANADLQSIYNHIAHVLLAPETAKNQAERIMDAADALEHMPLRHQRCANEPWGSMGWRVMPVDNYVVIYYPNEHNMLVSIMRIMYGGRDIEAQLNMHG